MPTTGGVTLVSDNAQVGADVIKTGNIKNGEIIDADINATAAIGWSKVSKTSSRISDLASHDINDTDTTLGVSKGGTGVATLTAHGVVIGNTTGAVAVTGAGTSGQVLTSNGASADPTFQDSPVVSIIPVESGNLGDVLRVVEPVVTADATSAAQNGAYGGNSGLKHRYAYRFIGTGLAMSSLKVNLRKTGAPTNNSIVRLETDSAGVPSGTLADANATSTFANSGFTTSFVDTTVTFSGSFTPAAGTTYWLVFNVDAAYSDTNFMETGEVNLSQRGQLDATHNGTSWSAGDYNYVLYISAAAGLQITGVQKNRQVAVDNGIIGMAKANYTQGTAVTVATKGQLITGMSGLVAGYRYPLSATAGALGTAVAAADNADTMIQAITATTAIIVQRP